MTLAANDISDWPKHNWYHDLLNQLVYDCGMFAIKEEEMDDCLKQREALREIMLPTVKTLLKDMYWKTLHHYLKREGDLLMHKICLQMDSDYPWTYILQSFDQETQEEKVARLIDFLAKYFKIPQFFLFDWQMMAFVLSFEVTLEDPPSHLLSYEECLDAYYTNFTQEAKAALIFSMKIFNESPNIFSLPRFTLNFLKAPYYIPEGSKLDALNNKVMISINDLTGTSKLAVGNIFMYFKNKFTYTLHPEPSGPYASLNCDYSNATELDKVEALCQELQVVIQENYNVVLKVMKQTLRPYDYKVRELIDLNDLEKTAQDIFSSSGYAMKNVSDFTHYNPMVLTCNFGHNTDADEILHCDDILRTYTNVGIGYSINSANFYEIYKSSQQTDIFCNEIVLSADKNCGQEDKNVLKKIELNGPKFALRLMLHVPKKKEGALPSFLVDPTHEWDEQSISIHSSKSMPFMSGNVIKPSPGMHTTVVVTPRVTITDDALSQSEIGRKKCLSSKYDPNPLTMFKHYSQNNCNFECNFKYAKERNNCVPWNFPRLSASDMFCHHDKVESFMKDLHMENIAERDCSHCIEECDRVDYEHVIHTTPFRGICHNNKFSITKAIGGVSNVKSMEDYFEMGVDFDKKFHMNDVCLSYAHENIATVDVYVGPPKAVHITRSPRVTFLQQVANLGMILVFYNKFWL